MPEPDAVLLDLYDTVAWSDWPEIPDRISTTAGVDHDVLLEAFEATREQRGTGVFGSPEGDIRAVLEACGVSLDPEAISDIVRGQTAFLVGGGVRLYEDAIPTLRSLRARGVRTALISNCDHFTGPVVEALGLAGEVDDVLLSFEVGAMKPYPAIYREALKRLGAVPERTIFVDDQVTYCDGAASLGLGTYLMVRPDTHTREGVSIETNGHSVIRGLEALLA
jgi:HAD superfamily hydrolase (TIGR01509 family)